MIIPDTNMLIYVHNETDRSHPAAVRWWSRLLASDEQVGIPWSVASGFVRITTKRDVLARPLNADTAVSIVTEWLDHPRINIVNPGVRHLTILRELLTVTGTAGNLVPDAHIAAIAIEHDADVHSRDRDFGRFPGLRWRNPLAATA